MELALWVLLSMFAAVGVVRFAGWMVCRCLRPPQSGRGYYAVLLETSLNEEELEAELRYQLALVRWGGRCGTVLLVAGEQERQAQAICQRLLRVTDPVILCRPEDVGGLLLRQSGAVRL